MACKRWAGEYNRRNFETVARKCIDEIQSGDKSPQSKDRLLHSKMDTESLVVGFVYLLLGAVCGGSFGLPSKYVPKDTPWENLWGPFFLFVTIAMPLLVGPMLVNDFFAVFARTGMTDLLMPLVFGLLWGAGSMTLGMSFCAGRAVAGVFAQLRRADRLRRRGAHGPAQPRADLHGPGRRDPAGRGGLRGGRGGRRPGRHPQGPQPERKTIVRRGAGEEPKSKMLAGLILAILSGFLCACYGVAASYTDPVAEVAKEQFRNDPWQVSCVTTAVILFGGAVSSCLYCVFQLTKNKTWKNFAGPGTG